MSERKPTEIKDVLFKVAQNARLVIFAFDLHKNKFTYLNQYFGELWQLELERVMHAPEILLERVHTEDHALVKKFYHNIVKNPEEDIVDIEFRIILDDESVRWLNLNSVSRIQHGDEEFIAGFVEDISDFKENQFLLNKFAAKKNAVLEILSHDLSRPLTNLESLSELLSEKLGSSNEEIAKIIDMISRTSKQAVRLIRSFVHQEFLESVQGKLIMRRVNIVSEIRQLVEQYKEEEDKIAKYFHFESSSQDISIKIDDAKFMQVVNNLLSNAIKFTPDGGQIRVSVSESIDFVQISVEDNGIGIPRDLQESLFERFNDARREGLKGEPSTGLGMSIIKNIVEWHEGKIWFESEEGKGSTFFIQLPKK